MSTKRQVAVSKQESGFDTDVWDATETQTLEPQAFISLEERDTDSLWGDVIFCILEVSL